MRRLYVLAVLFGALVLASMASTAGAGLIGHFRVTDSETYADTQCGIDGTSVFNAANNIQVFADNTYKTEARITQLFTSAATGKSVLLSYSFLFIQPGPAIDNGDGTLTFTESVKGLMEMLKLPNGAVLSRDAGVVTFNDTYDATTGEFIGQTISPENGPHPDFDSGMTLFCDVIVPALS